MKKISIFLTLMISFLSFGQDSIPEFIKRYHEENSKANLKVFVGEKINIKKELDTSGGYQLDEKFSAKYKVLKNIYGQIKLDTITFIAFDHYGKPPFSEYKYALLYVIKQNDEYYHCKYQYNPLFKTKNNRWAGPYSTYDYGRNVKDNSKIKPEIIKFKENPKIDFANYSVEDAKKRFIEPYYKIIGHEAIIIYGNYAEDLFELKKQGILKRRGYFK